jgi:hypothetical protein
MHALGIDCDNDVRHAYALDKRVPSNNSSSSGGEGSDSDTRERSSVRHAPQQDLSSSGSDANNSRRSARSGSDASEKSLSKVRTAEGPGTETAGSENAGSSSEKRSRGPRNHGRQTRKVKKTNKGADKKKDAKVTGKEKLLATPQHRPKNPGIASPPSPVAQDSPAPNIVEEVEGDVARGETSDSASEGVKIEKRKKQKRNKSPIRREERDHTGHESGNVEDPAVRPASPVKEVIVERSRVWDADGGNPSSYAVQAARNIENSKSSGKAARRIHRTRRVVHAERSRELAELSTSESEAESPISGDQHGNRWSRAPPPQHRGEASVQVGSAPAAALDDDADDYSHRSGIIQDQSFLGKDEPSSLQFAVPQRNFSSPRRGPTAAEGIGKIPHPPRLRKLLHSQVAPVDEAGTSPEGYEHLRGIWPYDPSLDAFRALVHRARERKKARRCLSNPVGERISYFPKKPAR